MISFGSIPLFPRSIKYQNIVSVEVGWITDRRSAALAELPAAQPESVENEKQL